MKPANLTCAEAASIPFGATTALYFLRDMAKLQSGQKVLIIGASGCTGVYAVQLAKYYGAEVTGVCSTRNLELVRSLGADHVIDYTKEDFTQNGHTYDVFLIWSQASLRLHAIKARSNQTGCIWPGQVVWKFCSNGLDCADRRQEVIAGMAPDRREDLVFLKELLEAEKLKPVIDRRYPWSRLPRRTVMRTQGTKGAALSSRWHHYKRKKELRLW